MPKGLADSASKAFRWCSVSTACRKRSARGRLQEGRNPTLRHWPTIFSGEIDVLPRERRDMGQRIGRQQPSFAFLVRDHFAKLHGVPEDDDRGKQVHAGDPVVLPFGGTVADFAPAMEADGSLQRMMRVLGQLERRASCVRTGRNLMKTPDFANFMSTFIPLETRKRE